MAKPAQFFDRHWKALPDEVILALVRLVLPQVGDTLTPWQTELVVPSVIRADQVYIVSLGPLTLILHLEFQSTLDAQMPDRIWTYDTDLDRLARSRGLQNYKIVSVVIWTCPGATPPPVYHDEFAGLVLAHKEYHEIHLTEMQWQQASDPLLLVLAPYFGTVTAPDLVPIALELYDHSPPHLREGLLGALLALGEYQFTEIDDIIQAVLEKVGKTMDEILQAIAQSSIGLALVERGKAEGLSEGKAVGIAEGKVVGMAEGKNAGIVEGLVAGEEGMRRHLLQRRWQKRFGQTLDEDQANQIATLPQERFDEIFDALEDGVLGSAEILAMVLPQA